MYDLPASVLKAIEQGIDGNYEDLFFVMGTNEKYYYIWAFNGNNQGDHFINNTNRKVLINGKLYPLIFTTDFDFGNAISYKEYIKIIKEEGLYTHNSSTMIIDLSPIIFDFKGVIYEAPPTTQTPNPEQD